MSARVTFSFIALIALVSAVAFGASPVHAADLSLPVDTVIYAEEGTLTELGRVPVDVDVAGPLCTWEASVTNQGSTHPGNDILVISGDTTLTLSGVEDAPGKVTSESGSVHLVDEVVVVLRMGPDGVFSGGLDLSIRYDSCGPVPTTEPTTTTAPEPQGPVTVDVTTTTAPTTVATAPATTVATTAPPPAGPTTAPPPAGPAMLPVSGPSRLASTAGVGLALVVAGGLLTRMVRRGLVS